MKITDKMRLDFLDRLAREGTEGGFFAVNGTDGSIHRMDCSDSKDSYAMPLGDTVRVAIDAAIRASRRGKKR